jgi:hypothetical protein
MRGKFFNCSIVKGLMPTETSDNEEEDGFFDSLERSYDRVKGIQLGRTGTTVSPRSGIGDPSGSSNYSPGVIDAEYSLSSPKTICSW